MFFINNSNNNQIQSGVNPGVNKKKNKINQKRPLIHLLACSRFGLDVSVQPDR